MAGLIIDGGIAFARQRHTQNAADASAKAGAIQLARRAAEFYSPVDENGVPWGERIRNEVLLMASRNRVVVAEAVYTTYLGVDIAGEYVDGRTPPIGAAGVRVEAQQAFGTTLIRVLGFANWTVTQSAVAVSGPTAGCPDTIEGCILLPIAFPVTVLQCGQGNTSVPADPPGSQWERGVELTIPLCGGNPGSVGWIDWTPPSGGTSELEDVILDPPPQDIPLPSWKYITETGDISASTVEDALNQYAGDVVLFPLFDSTCPEEPTNPELSGCPVEPGGSGTNQWYHITQFLAFQLSSPQGAFVNGDYSAECADAFAKECIKGAFVSLVTEGSVGAPCTESEEACKGLTYSVQLVK